jgi:hypothetical protein
VAEIKDPTAYLPKPEDVLEAVKTGQQTALRVVNAWTDSVRSVTPVAFGTLPTPEQLSEYVDRAFDTANEVLAAQREFAQAVVHSAGTAYEAATKAVRDVTAA